MIDFAQQIKVLGWLDSRYVSEVAALIPTIEKLLIDNGGKVFKKPWDLTLFGLRDRNAVNNWNDWLGVIYHDAAHTKIMQLAIGTTDPGTPYLQKPMNKKGTGILPAGFHQGLWKLGLHKGEYRAFVQARPVTVHRDNDKDLVLDVNGEDDAGWFGCNGHKNYKSNQQNVNFASALCQVWHNERAYWNTIALAEKQIAAGVGFTFSYNLVDITDSKELSQLAPFLFNPPG